MYNELSTAIRYGFKAQVERILAKKSDFVNSYGTSSNHCNNDARVNRI